MKTKFSRMQRTAIRFARRGALVRCPHGYKVESKPVRIAAATVNSLVARGWLVVSKATPAGDPIEVNFVGQQIDLPLHSRVA